MKGMGKRIFGLCADTFGLNKRMQGPQALVLRLHRILPESAFEKLRFQRQHALSEDGLDHLLTLLKRKYTLIHLDDYLALEPHQFPRRERFACLTLDDGWQDNFVYGFPLLKAHDAPVSIFLTEGYMGTDKPFWWQVLGDAFHESLHHADKEKLLQAHVTALDPNARDFTDIDSFFSWVYCLDEPQRIELARAVSPLVESLQGIAMNWEQARIMGDSGLVRFGAQSCSHLPLSLQDEEAAMEEIKRAYAMFSTHGEIVFNRLFCYPQGGLNERVMAMVAAAGFSGAVSNFSCYASRQVRERYRLPRLNITEALARDPALLSYRLLKVGTQRGRLLASAKTGAMTPTL